MAIGPISVALSIDLSAFLAALGDAIQLIDFLVENHEMWEMERRVLELYESRL